jgi:hypothetical protein
MLSEDAIRKQHTIDIAERYNPRTRNETFQPRCSCKKYRGAWQSYKGQAIQNGRIHVQKMIDEEAER